MSSWNLECRIAVAAALAMVLYCGNTAAANKCVGPDGRVSFQDAPCASGAQSSEPIRLRENTVSNGVGRPAAPEPLSFGSDVTGNVVVAAAALDVLATNGRDCEIELKVRPDSEKAAASCNRFLAQHQAWRSAAGKVVGDAIKDADWWQANQRLAQRATDSAAKVNQAYAFVSLFLKGGR